MSAEAINALVEVLESLIWGVVASFVVAMVALFMAIIAWARLSALEKSDEP